MVSWDELRGNANVWPGRLGRKWMTDWEWQESFYLDDRAKAGGWETVLEILRPDNHLVNINQWLPGSKLRSTVLHRAAGNLAPADVIEALLGLGAFRSQPNSDGLTAYEIANNDPKIRKKIGESVLELLKPPPSPINAERRTAINAYLGEALDWWFGDILGYSNPRAVLCYPPVEVLHEPPGQELWMQQPSPPGGVRVMLRRGYLEVLMGFREFPESGVRVVTYGCVVTEFGWAKVYESDSTTTFQADPLDGA